MTKQKKSGGLHNPRIKATNECDFTVSHPSTNKFTQPESDCQTQPHHVPGWLISAATRPVQAGGPTAKQLAALTSLLRQVGKLTYWRIKEDLGIRRTLPMTWLTRRQARDLIGELIAVVDGGAK